MKKVLENRGIQKFIFVGIMTLLMTVVFWTVYPIFTYDSFVYLTYLDYFEGVKRISEWDPMRGFTFPLLLWIGRKLNPSSQTVFKSNTSEYASGFDFCNSRSIYNGIYRLRSAVNDRR